MELQIGMTFEVVSITSEYWDIVLNIGSQYVGLIDDAQDFNPCCDTSTFAFEEEHKPIGRLTITKLK